MTNALDTILDYKAEEVAELLHALPLQSLRDAAEQVPSPKDFVGSIREVIDAGENALICEIKRKSPSAGSINPTVVPSDSAKTYKAGGAACISVLTDTPSFGGTAQDLLNVRAAVDIPVLRKDFIVDISQIYQSRLLGADAILLIMAALSDAQASEYHACAEALGMAVLIESHDEIELERALQLSSPLIGVNNRNLKLMKTELETTERLSTMVPDDRILISESGIHKAEDISRLKKHGASCFLIGESLMKSNNVEANIRKYRQIQ